MNVYESYMGLLFMDHPYTYIRKDC